MKRRLPLVVEQAIGTAESSRVRLAKDFHRHVQLELGRPPVCKKGCSNCCFYPITVTALEAISIFRWLYKKRRWSNSLKKVLKAASDRVWGLAPEVWLLARVPCPFLAEDKSCSIYEVRPFTCRVTYSGGDPELCDPHNIVDIEQVPRRDVLEQQYDMEHKTLKKNRLTRAQFPLASGVLFAERIVKGELDIRDLGVKAFQGAP